MKIIIIFSNLMCALKKGMNFVMEENKEKIKTENVDNKSTEKTATTKDSGKGATIALTSIVIILLLAVGVLTGVLFFGKGTTIVNNINEEVNKEIQNTSNNVSNESKNEIDFSIWKREFGGTIYKAEVNKGTSTYSYTVEFDENAKPTISVNLYDINNRELLFKTQEYTQVKSEGAAGTKYIILDYVAWTSGGDKKGTLRLDYNETRGYQSIGFELDDESIPSVRLDNYTKDNGKILNKLIGEKSKYQFVKYDADLTEFDKSVGDKIKKRIDEHCEEVYKDINGQAVGTDKAYQDIYEHLNNLEDDIGFNLRTEKAFNSDKYVTFITKYDGSIGGVAWSESSGITFNKNTGEALDISKIVTDKEKYIAVCKEYVMNELKKDTRYQYVVEYCKEANIDYEEIISEQIEKLGSYLDETGVAVVYIPKYVIASGADGAFEYSVPYSLVNNYINLK